MDYSKYILSPKEKMIVSFEAFACAIVVTYLFYDNLWGIILVPGFMVFIAKRTKNKKIEERRITLTEDFIDFLKNLSTALLAGYSIENAWSEGQKELGLLHGTNGLMYREVSEMNRAIKVNLPIEEVFEKFAKRTGVDDISNFAEIFQYAKRSGGDFVRIIDSTTDRISQKFETYREIDVSLASKKLEQRIMNCIPIFILAYLKFTSPDYMEAVYTGIIGRGFMTICLIAYGGALLLSEKIVNISV